MAYTKISNVKRVAIYIRVSTVHQIDKDSLPMQREDLINYCKYVLNITDYEIFEDAGYSAKNTDRPSFQRMLAKIREGLFSHVLVWKIDRISRNLLDFANMYSEFKKTGVTFVSKNEQFQTDTAIGEAMLKIILVFAELERNMTSERVTATMIARAGEGKWNGGTIPFGYDYDTDTKQFTINEQESLVVEEIFNKYEEIKSVTKIAAYLNDKEYTTKIGGSWSATSVHIALRNVFYIGSYRYNCRVSSSGHAYKPEDEWVVFENHHPAIISEEQFLRCEKIMKSSRTSPYRLGVTGVKHVYPFAKLMTCTKCGGVINSSKSTSKQNGKVYIQESCICGMAKRKKCDTGFFAEHRVGEFVFNIILNMLNAQKKITDINSPAELEKELLKGNAFKNVERICQEDLDELYIMMQKLNSTAIPFGTEVQFSKKQAPTSEIALLRKEKEKLERALDRLRTLYLYSDDSMPEKDYVIEKRHIDERLEEICNKLSAAQFEEDNGPISDEYFVDLASRFIMIQKLTDRNYINYKTLRTQVDLSVLRTFVISIINDIGIRQGVIDYIVFKNGLILDFEYSIQE